MNTLNNIERESERRGTALRAWLDTALGNMRLPTGTLAAHALHDLFLSEARQQGWDAAEAAWLAFDAQGLAAVVRELEHMVWKGHHKDYTLPAGTVMMECMSGSAMIGYETLGFDIDRPGLHDIYYVSSRPAGSNLALLMRLIDGKSTGLPCRAIGLPTLVERFVGPHLEHHLQFPPYAPAGGVTLQREMNFCSWGELFCAFTEDRIHALAESVLFDMNAFFTRSHSFEPRAGAARLKANRIAMRLADVRVHAVTMDISNQTSRGDVLAVEFKAWDHAFRRGVVVQMISEPMGWEVALDARKLDRRAAVATVGALGADGWIRGIARAILAAAPRGAAAVLGELADGFETFVTLSTRTRPLLLRLYWRHGEIKVATVSGYGVDVTDRSVTLRDRVIPESLITILPGRPVQSVFDAPFRCGTPIASIENKDGNVIVKPQADPWLVNCRSGHTWPENANEIGSGKNPTSDRLLYIGVEPGPRSASKRDP